PLRIAGLQKLASFLPPEGDVMAGARRRRLYARGTVHTTWDLRSTSRGFWSYRGFSEQASNFGSLLLGGQPACGASTTTTELRDVRRGRIRILLHRCQGFLDHFERGSPCPREGRGDPK